jgi:hypothetical protein
MKRYFAAILVAVSFFVLLALISKSAASPKQAVFITPTPTPANLPPSLLDLDKRELLIPAPPGYGCRERCDEEMSINVRTRGLNPADEKNVYKYTVSGGIVIGAGKNIKWGLFGAKPGTYTITVSVSDGEKTREATKTIVVRDCRCYYDCFCPTISVNGEHNVKAGETVEFSAQVSGGTVSDINYNWTISQGEIIDGQGTPEISVKISPGMTGSVKATVEISGELCVDCARTASALTEITK